MRQLYSPGYRAVKSASSTSVIRDITSRIAPLAMRSSEKLDGATGPSSSAEATSQGMLWSAVSRVFGSHFSGSLDAVLAATL